MTDIPDKESTGNFLNREERSESHPAVRDRRWTTLGDMLRGNPGRVSHLYQSVESYDREYALQQQAIEDAEKMIEVQAEFIERQSALIRSFQSNYNDFEPGNRGRVEQFLETASKRAGQHITKKMFYSAAGYNDATCLQAFERNDPDPKKNTHRARGRFEKLLRGDVEAFLETLIGMRLISPAFPRMSPHSPA